jgi:glutathione S-transferase
MTVSMRCRPDRRGRCARPHKETRMKLYFAPGTCSLSPQIVIGELGLEAELVKVDNKTKKTADGRDFRAINPKGYVPALQLDDGQYLTEGPVVAQYLADLRPDAGLAPPSGSFERVRLQEWLCFISTEIHKTFSGLFDAKMPEAAKALFKDKLAQRFDFVERALQAREFLLGTQFGVADAYLFTVTRWASNFDIDLSRWPALSAFMRRVEARPAVQAALSTERAAKKAA